MKLADLKFKPNVMAAVSLCSCGGLEAAVHESILFALDITRRLWASRNHPAVTVTSLMDGKHSANSLHYIGKAVDIRTFDLPGGYKGSEATELARLLTNMLSPLGFDVVHEDTHIHIEYDPK